MVLIEQESKASSRRERKGSQNQALRLNQDHKISLAALAGSRERSERAREKAYEPKSKAASHRALGDHRVNQ